MDVTVKSFLEHLRVVGGFYSVGGNEGEKAFARNYLKAADTIERLQKERDEQEALYLKYYDLGHNCSIELGHAQEQLAEVRAEVECQAKDLATSEQVRQSLDDVVARTNTSPADAIVEVEKLKAEIERQAGEISVDVEYAVLLTMTIEMITSIEREIRLSGGEPPPPSYIPEIGMDFCGTFALDSEAEARLMANAMDLVVKPFGVNLKTAAPSPVTWERTPGWSTWAWRPRAMAEKASGTQ